MANIFESIHNTSDKTFEIGEKYLHDTQAYYKLKIFQQLSISISMIVKILMLGGLLFIGLLFMAVAAALAIGNWMGNMALGYVIVAILFFIGCLVVYVNRAVINRKVISKLSPKFFDI